MNKIINSLILGVLFTVITFSAQAQTLPPKSYWIDTDNNGRQINTGVVKERYAEDSDGSIHGKYISYYRNGIKHQVVEYLHGKIHGKYEEYFESGELKTRCYYQNNTLHGSYYSIEYRGLGEFRGTKTNYTNGKENGAYEKRIIKNINAFFQTSSTTDQLIEKGQYINGKKDGQWYEDGQPDGTGMQGSYKNGLREGEWKNTYLNPKFGDLPFYKNGWKVIFQGGEAIQAFDDQGIDLLAKKIQEKADQTFSTIETEKDMESFIHNYPQDFRVKEVKEKLKSYQEEKAKEEKIKRERDELIEKERTAFDQVKYSESLVDLFNFYESYKDAPLGLSYSILSQINNHYPLDLYRGFSRNSYLITSPELKEALDKLVEALKPDVSRIQRITLIGNSDSYTDTISFILAYNRAYAVGEYLKKELSLPSNLPIQIISLGEYQKKTNFVKVFINVGTDNKIDANSDLTYEKIFQSLVQKYQIHPNNRLLANPSLRGTIVKIINQGCNCQLIPQELWEDKIAKEWGETDISDFKKDCRKAVNKAFFGNRSQQSMASQFLAF